MLSSEVKRIILSLLLIVMVFPAYASDYGCNVLLCLSNPASNGGAEGVPECVQPIEQLYDDLDHGRPFPSCDTANSSYAQQIFDPYDPCPAPLIPAPQGQAVVQGDANGSVTAIAQISEAAYSAHSPRACVGKLLGQCRTCMQGLPNEYIGVNSANVYDQIVWQQWKNPSAIDVYIDGKFYQRVRQ